MVCRRIKNNRGAVLVLVAVCMVVLLGMAALVVDLGRLFVARQRAQNVADASALAGAWLLDGTTACKVPANEEAQDIGEANNTSNANWLVEPLPGASDPDVTPSAVAVDFPTSISKADGTTVTVPEGSAIRVRCRTPVAYRFAPVLGSNSGSPSATAIVVRSAMQSWTSRLGPVGLLDSYLEDKGPGDPIDAAIKANLSSGNFGAIILPGDDVRKQTYEERLAGTAGDVEVSLEDLLQVDNRHGNITKPTADGLATRIGSDTTTWDQWVEAGMPDDCPRIIILPVLSSTSTSTNQSFDVVGFVGFFIEGWDPINGAGNVDPRIFGRFISGTTSGGVTHWDLYSSEQGSDPMVEIRMVT